MQAAVLIFEVAALDVALAAAIAAGAVIAVVAITTVDLRADDGADGQAADHARGDRAVACLRRLRRSDEGQGEGSNRRGGNEVPPG